MVYPLISEYTEAILSAEDNFNELSYLRPVLDDNGNPIMSSGNFAVVYKMRDINTGKYHAVKCFTRDQENRNKRYKNICSTLSEEKSPYLTTFSFHEAELFVDSSQTDETEFPVLLMDWVDGKPLDKFIEEYSGNPFVLYELCYNFRLMAKWLVSKSFAHGDLKPDNILVQEDANIVLIDYDGMYVWSRERQEAPEGGTPEYRNPFHQTYYNGQMDDFALAVLALSLNLISISYDVQNKYNRGNGLLFSVEDIKDINNSEIFIFLRELLISEPLLGQYYATFIKSLSGNTLIESDFDFKNEREIDNLLLFNPVIGKTADNGIIYSSDGRFVIGYDNSVPYDEDLEDNYIYIKEGTIGIVENAFDYDTPKLQLFFPSTLRYFSSKSLNYRYKKISWNSPWYSYKDGFIFTKDLSEAVLQHLNDAKFETKTKILGIGLYENLQFDGNWPINLKRIRKDAFRRSKGIDHLVIPKTVIEIGYRSFQYCSVTHVLIPMALKTLGSWSFQFCDNLVTIDFDKNEILKNIKESTFNNCKKLRHIYFPQKLIEIEERAFQWCYSLESLSFPESVKKIGKEAFSMKKLMSDDADSIIKKIIFNGEIEKLDENAFISIQSLEEIHFKSDVDEIGKDCFKDCKVLKKIEYSKINIIEERAFKGCNNLNFEITENINVIKPGALTGTKITLRNSNYEIINDALFSKSNFYDNSFTGEIELLRKNLIYYWGNKNIIEIPEGIRYLSKDSFLTPPSAIKLPKSFIETNLKTFINSFFWNDEIIRCFIVPNYFNSYIDEESEILFTHEDIYIDSYGVYYSKNKKKLLFFPHYITLESYKIVDGCEEINDFAFVEKLSVDDEGASYYGNKLKQLICPKTLKKIGSYALIGCHSLKVLYLPRKIESIGENALPPNINIIIPKGSYSNYENFLFLKTQSHIIDYYEDYDGKSNFVDEHGVIYSHDKKILLKFPLELEIEEYSVCPECIEIGENAFESFGDSNGWTIKNEGNKLNKLSLSSNLEIIRKFALVGCTQIRNLYLPEKIKEIEDGAFVLCENLKDITIPNSIKRLGKDVFPKSLTYIRSLSSKYFVQGKSLFEKNNNELKWMPRNINYLDFPEEIIFEGYNCKTYNDCIVTQNEILIWVSPTINTFMLPQNVKKIGNSAFNMNKKIKILYIPEGIDEIFDLGIIPNMTDLYLPASIKKIGNIRTRIGQGKYFSEEFPHNVHIPQGTQSYFTTLIPDIPEHILIEDYDGEKYAFTENYRIIF